MLPIVRSMIIHLLLSWLLDISGVSGRRFTHTIIRNLIQTEQDLLVIDLGEYPQDLDMTDKQIEEQYRNITILFHLRKNHRELS
jgi:hypothetical protein